jgi:hypothetical protein
MYARQNYFASVDTPSVDTIVAVRNHGKRTSDGQCVFQSGPKPGIPHLDIYRIGSRAVGEIQSGVQPEPAGELVAKSDARAADTLPI